MLLPLRCLLSAIAGEYVSQLQMAVRRHVFIFAPLVIRSQNAEAQVARTFLFIESSSVGWPDSQDFGSVIGVGISILSMRGKDHYLPVCQSYTQSLPIQTIQNRASFSPILLGLQSDPIQPQCEAPARDRYTLIIKEINRGGLTAPSRQ